MKSLALHVQCLRELERDRKVVTTGHALALIGTSLLTALGIAGCYALEEIVREKLGMR